MTDTTPKIKKVSREIMDALGISNADDAVIIKQTTGAEVRCPECGAETVNVQEDHATCLNCGYVSDDVAVFVKPQVVYIKTVQEEAFPLSRVDVRFKTRCPECGSRDLNFQFGHGMVHCNKCEHEGTVQDFYAPKAHPWPGADLEEEEEETVPVEEQTA